MLLSGLFLKTSSRLFSSSTQMLTSIKSPYVIITLLILKQILRIKKLKKFFLQFLETN
jgi:hypothetical protein